MYVQGSLRLVVGRRVLHRNQAVADIGSVEKGGEGR